MITLVTLSLLHLWQMSLYHGYIILLRKTMEDQHIYWVKDLALNPREAEENM